jgi:cell wall-associated NlpC family hydrolase
LLGCLVAAGTAFPATAQAAPDSAVRISNAALNWAEVNAKGHPYVWAGTGPYGYDCSGLVLAAFRAEGIELPHNTVAMIESGKLVRVYHPQRGDLAFWGSPSAPYHVEFVTRWWHTTFGAREPGTVVYWHKWNGYFAPGSFWRVI